jgi:hypothetical protein
MARKNSNRKSTSAKKINQSPRWDSNFHGRNQRAFTTVLLVVPMDLADFNVSKTLLFLI